MNGYMYDAMYNTEKTHWWFHAKRDIILDIVRNIGLSKDASIVDFGCGTGAMIEALAQHGIVTGIDCSDKALEYCKKRFHGRLLQHDLSKRLPLENEFDIGVALDVLEHLDDDLSALQNMSGALKQSGRLILTAPAHMFLWTAHDENLMHKRRYNAKGLSALIQKAGLEIEYISYYNFWLFPVTAFLRIIFRLLKLNQDSSAENKQMGTIINNFLYRLFRSERFFTNKKTKLPFGVSILAVLRRDMDA